MEIAIYVRNFIHELQDVVERAGARSERINPSPVLKNSIPMLLGRKKNLARTRYSECDWLTAAPIITSTEQFNR